LIVYGVCVGSVGTLQKFTAPSISRASKGSVCAIESFKHSSIFEAYNSILSVARKITSLSALVLMHEDVELLDSGFESKIRAELESDDAAIVGTIGASKVTSIAWWEGEKAGRCLDSNLGLLDFGSESVCVDAVDGHVLVLSPWAVNTLQFDSETFSGYHAYDVDICFQARSLGKKVIASPLGTFHHSKGGYGDKAAWEKSDFSFKRKWFGV
jgi:hypothetical protein